MHPAAGPGQNSPWHPSELKCTQPDLRRYRSGLHGSLKQPGSTRFSTPRPGLWLLVGGVCIGTLQLVACSSKFNTCAERRTCAGKGGAAGESGEASEAAGEAGGGGVAESPGDGADAGDAGHDSVQESAGSAGDSGLPQGPECVAGTARCASTPPRRELCSSAGQWSLVESCAPGSSCIGSGASCLKDDGSTCIADSECASNACKTYYADADDDGYGATTSAKKICGVTPPVGSAAVSGDCCDSDLLAHPGQSAYYLSADKCGNFDYDCADGEVLDPSNSASLEMNCNVESGTCSVVKAGWDSTPMCGVANSWATGCAVASGPIGAYCKRSYSSGHPQIGCH